MKNFKKYLEIKFCLDALNLTDDDRIKIRKEYKADKTSNLKKLSKFTQNNIYEIDSEKVKDQESILSKMRFFILSVMSVSGFFLGYALLNYNVQGQINVTSFFITLILIPFVMFLIALYTMVKLLIFQNIKHGALLFSVNYILKKFSIQLDTDLFYVLTFWKLQEGSLALIIGTSFALILTLIGKFVPFGWESTLIDSSMMQSIINTIVYPWKSFLPSAIPSIELIQHTQYYQHNAYQFASSKQSESWWQFLGMSLLIWGMIPRMILLFLSKINLSFMLDKNLLHHPKAKKLLYFMNEEYITTTRPLHQRDGDTQTDILKESSFELIDLAYNLVITWDYDVEEVVNILQVSHLPIKEHIIPIDNFYKDKEKILRDIVGTVLIIVAAYESPTKDIITFINTLLSNGVNLIIYPAGTAKKAFTPTQDDLLIWKNKMLSIDALKVLVFEKSELGLRI